MKDSLQRFLGDTPKRIIFKLLIISVVFGVLFTLIGLTPSSIAWGFYYFFQFIWDGILSIWAMGFDAFGSIFNVILTGAAFVIPIFLIIRLFKWK